MRLESASVSSHRSFESPVRLREVRLVSGLVLGAFLVTHFSNHALGLVSLEAMESGRRFFNLLWRNPVGTGLLYGALLVHFALALQAIYRRRTLRMPMREAAQLAFGLALPFLLIPHVVTTRIELGVMGHDSDYSEVLRTLWIVAPELGARQAATLLIAWLHFCLGMYFWLRSKPLYRRFGLALYTGALLIPVLALLGFAEAGEEIARLPPGPAEAPPAEILAKIKFGLFVAFGAAIGGAFAARATRIAWNWSTRLRITYPGGRVVTVPFGFSVLEASRTTGIPHASICGGRGRCSTCRIRVLEGHDRQPPPSPQEAATLRRIKAEPQIRLACQLRPSHDLTVVPLVSQSVVERRGIGGRADRSHERDIAVLFCDLRGFTALTEKRLPFDTVFLLNRYFDVVGQAVEQSGGHMDKFVGDGALALFGLETDAATACHQALRAAARIGDGVAQLNSDYASELHSPLQIAMSLHAGPAVVGRMGYGDAMTLTAIGDTVNAGSRLEGLAKELDAELVISEDLARLAGVAVSAFDQRTLALRGRTQPITVWIVRNVADLEG